MRHNAIIYFRLIGAELRSQMQYRMSLFMEIVSTGLLNFTYFFTLILIFERFGGLAGWSIAEVAFLFGLVEMSFATMDLIFSGFDPDWFAPQVRLGTLDQLLLRPVSITLQIFAARFMLRRLGRIFEGLIMLMLALIFNPIQWDLGKVLYLPLVFASQVCCFGALFMVGSTLTFWTKQKIEAVNIVTYGGTEVMTYPTSIYPVWLRHIFTYIFPFIFLNYYPALYFLGKPDPLGFPPFAPFIAPLVAVVFMGLALTFWQFGLNHYQSTGS